MSLTKEELVKMLTAQVRQRIADIKDAGDNPLTDEKLRQMIADVLAEQDKNKRNGPGFNDADVNVIEYAAKNGSKMITLPDENIKIHAAMLASEEELKDYYGNSSLVERIRAFQKENDELLILGTMLNGARNRTRFQESMLDTLKSTRLYQRIQAKLAADKELQKALDTGTAGSGAEWIPTGFSSQLVEKIRLERKVAALFPTVNMPTNPYKFPVESTGATGYLIPESTGDDSTKIKASTPTTANFQFTAKKLAGRVVFSEEINEDSIVNMLPFVQNNLGVAIAEAIETAILNGDDSTTHQDTNVTSAYDARKAFKGLRYYALNNAGTSTKDASNANLTTKLLRSTRLLMGKYGVDPKKLAWICSTVSYIQFLGLSEVLTLDKYGPNATVLNGELGKFDGSPIIVSEFMWDNLNASGKYDGSTTDRTMVLGVFTPAFWIGNRTGVVLASEKDIETDQMKLVAKTRIAFEDPYDATLAANVQSAALINVKTTL